MIEENKLLETLTAILFLAGFIFGIFFMMRLRNQRYQKLYFPLPIFSLMFFWDEVSCGKDIFNFTPPKLGSTEVDGVHDFFEIFYQQIKSLGDVQSDVKLLSALAIFGGTLLVAFSFIFRIRFSCLKEKWNKIGYEYLPLKFLRLAIAF